jgi:hypothetical protein
VQVLEDGKYVPAIKHIYQDVDSPKELKCVDDFWAWSKKMHRRGRLACSDPLYPLRKNCALHRFFENKPAEESRIVSGDFQG